MDALTFVTKTCVTTGFALVVYLRLHTIVQLGYLRHLQCLLIVLVVVSIAPRVPEITLIVVIKNADHASGFLTTLSNRIWYVDFDISYLRLCSRRSTSGGSTRTLPMYLNISKQPSWSISAGQ